MMIYVGYRLTVTRKDGTVLYTCYLGGGSLAAALKQAADRVSVMMREQPQHELVATLEARAQ